MITRDELDGPMWSSYTYDDADFDDDDEDDVDEDAADDDVKQGGGQSVAA